MAIDDDHVTAASREVARAMWPSLPTLGPEVAEHIAGVLPEFTQPRAAELLVVACQANSDLLLDSLTRGVSLDEMAPSAGVIRSTRDLARARITQESVVRGYQVGVAYWCERWAEAVQQHCDDLALALRVVRYGTAFLLAWAQADIDRLSAEYRDEAERLTREGSMARTAEVKRVLTGDDVDVVALGQRLGYDLRGHHVALVLHREAAGEATLETVARALARTISKARPLVVLVDVDTTWCWIPTDVDKELPDSQDAVLCGQGRPGKGLEGFRRSHREACEAVRVARLAGRPAGTLTPFGDVELAALCSADPAACYEFVRSELGALAADTAHARRMRETLRAFYDANSRFRATASRLGLHHNTVRYRLGQAEKRLGRGTDERRLHTELALHLAARLYGAARTEHEA